MATPRLTAEERWERFQDQLEWRGECLVWTGRLDRHGYGRCGRSALAHRYAYEHEHGPIQAGVVIDHLCWTPACVNLDHLRATSQAANMRNRGGANRQNRSKVRGVSWSAATNKWRGRVMHERKEYHAGVFDSIEEAEAAVIKLREVLHGEDAGRSRRPETKGEE